MSDDCTVCRPRGGSCPLMNEVKTASARAGW